MWIAETAAEVRDRVASPRCDFDALGHFLRECDETFRNGEQQPAQACMARVMRAIAQSCVSVDDGIHALAAYLAEERGVFSKARMRRGFEAIEAKLDVPNFAEAVRSAGEPHHRDAFMWTAAALRVWLDVPQKLDEVVHDDK